MPLTEIDSNVSGRDSRASNVSASIKNAPKVSPSATGNDMLTGMLRTTTEVGDIGHFSATSRLHKLPRQGSVRRPAPLPRSVAPSRTSSHYSQNGSIHSAKSGRSVQDASMPGSWPYSHHPFANSQPDFHSGRSDTRSSFAQDSIRSLPLGLQDRLDPNDRSYSLTTTPPPMHPLRTHPSLTSLRSQDTISRPRSPLMPPAHLRNANYRPASPTLSDTASSLYAKRHAARPAYFPRANHASPYPQRDVMDAAHRHALTNNFPPRPRQLRRFDSFQRGIANGGLPAHQIANENLLPSQGLHQSPFSPHQRFHGAPSRSVNHVPHLRPPFNRSSSQDTSSLGREKKVNDTAPYMGFVQRVKTVLEERISHEDMSHQPNIDVSDSIHGINSSTRPLPLGTATPADYPIETDKASDAAVYSNETPPDAQVRLFEGPIQEPSSTVKRLTRDLVKNAMDAGSDVAATSDEADDPTLPEDEFEEPQELPQCEALPKTPASETEELLSSSKIERPKSPNAVGDQVDNVRPDAGYTRSKEELLHSVKSSLNSAAPNTPHHRRLSNQPNESQAASQSQDSKTSDNSYWPSSSPSGSKPDVAEHQRLWESFSSSMPGDFLQSRPPSFTEEIQEAEPIFEPKEIAASDLAADLQDGQAATLSPQDKRRTSVTRLEQLPPDEKANEGTTVGRNRHPETGDLHAVRNRTRSPTVHEERMRSFEFPIRGSSLNHSPTLENAPSPVPSAAPTNNEIRPSAMKIFQHPLPELAEDSQEDASTTNLRMLGAKKPGAPPRVPRDQRRKSRPAPRASAPPEPPQTYLTRTLAETRNIPSFNFSQQDLTSKLNDALGLRSSRSLEDITTLKSNERTPVALSRPLSSNLVSERYKSFFTASEASGDEYEGCAEVELPVDAQSMEQPPKSSVDEDLLREIEKLSIPSVKNLTFRLSELLPSIKNSRSDMNLSTVDHAVDETVQEIRELGSPVRMASMDLDETEIDQAKETSHELVRKQTVATQRSSSERKVPRDRVYLRLMKDLPALPLDDGKHPSRTSLVGSPAPRLTSKEEKRKATLYELEGSAILKTSREETRQEPKTAQSELGPILKTPTSKLSFKETTGTPSTPRPWNKQENYPWSGGTPTVTITDDSAGTSGAGLGKAPRLKLKKPRSDGDFSVNETERIARSMSPGPRCSSSLIPQADVFAEEGPGISKKGLLGSIKRKMGLGHRQDKAGVPVDPMFLHPEDHTATRTVRPGDRYPTSSLTPPGALNIDESRSYFSDDSSESEHVHGLRKRLTRLKAKRSAPEDLSPVDSGSDAHHSGENNVPSAERTRADFEHTSIFQQDQVPSGMSKAEFRAKRFIEKLRMIFLKSGEVLRHFHRPKKYSGGAWHRTTHT